MTQALSIITGASRGLGLALLLTLVAPPVVASDSGFRSNFTSSGRTAVDESGTSYPRRSYYVYPSYYHGSHGYSNYRSGNKPDEQPKEVPGLYKLTSDTDILADGQVAVSVGDGSIYLLLGPEVTVLTDRATGTPLLYLAPNPTQLWIAAKEIERCAKMGHRGVLFTGEPQSFGLPLMAHKHWEPIWAAAADHDLPISFHIGSGDFGDEFSDDRVEVEGYAATSARAGAKLFMQNGAHVLDLLFSGILTRYPKLRFISVESGIGWLPFLLQSADYQYKAMAVKKARNDLQMLPSEYFRRQVYACCWFEAIPDDAMLEFVGKDRIMFETDFPHPTSIYGSEVQRTIDESLGSLSADMRHRVLWENAKKLYEIETPKAG